MTHTLRLQSRWRSPPERARQSYILYLNRPKACTAPSTPSPLPPKSQPKHSISLLVSVQARALHFVSSERIWQSFSEVCLLPKLTPLLLVMREIGQQKSAAALLERSKVSFLSLVYNVLGRAMITLGASRLLRPCVLWAKIAPNLSVSEDLSLYLDANPIDTQVAEATSSHG